METIAFAVPVLPGNKDTLKNLARQLKNEKKDEFAGFLDRLNTTEESWYLQKFGEQDLCICYLKAENIGVAFSKLASSDHPFDKWIKDINKEIFGIDFDDSNNDGMPEVLFEIKR